MKKTNLIYIIAGVLLIVFLIYLIANKPSNTNQQQNNNQPSNGPAQIVNLGFRNNNYYPQTITVNQGELVRIVGDMSTLQGCFRAVQIPAFGVRKIMTEQNNFIEFVPNKKGTFGFSCYMNMGTGTLIVQ